MAIYFLFLLAVPSCICLDQINESGGIQIRNRPAANRRTLIASQVHNLATVGGPTAVVDCLAFGLLNSVPKFILSHIG